MSGKLGFMWNINYLISDTMLFTRFQIPKQKQIKNHQFNVAHIPRGEKNPFQSNYNFVLITFHVKTCRAHCMHSTRASSTIIMI